MIKTPSVDIANSSMKSAFPPKSDTHSHSKLTKRESNAIKATPETSHKQENILEAVMVVKQLAKEHKIIPNETREIKEKSISVTSKNFSMSEPVKDLFVEYRPKVDKKEKKKEITTYEEERIMNLANKHKKSLFQVLKRKRVEHELIKKVKLRQEVSIRESNNTIENKEAEKKNVIKKRSDQYLKLKKINKQLKKRSKLKTNFLLVDSYINEADKNVMSYIIDPRLRLEELLKRDFSGINISANYINKSFVNMLNEVVYFNVDKETAMNELNELKGFDGRLLYKHEADLNPQNSKMNITKEERKESSVKEMLVNLAIMKRKVETLEATKENIAEFIHKMKLSKDMMEMNHFKLVKDIPTVQIEENEKLSVEETRKIKQRLINFTMKTFDKFSIEEIISFWICKNRVFYFR